MQRIEKCITLKKELDALRPLKKADELRIMQKFRLDWNFHSNNIEGNTLTYGETKSLLLHNITAQGKPLRDHLEITGHNDAIEWILSVVKGDRPLSERFIRELHQLILKAPYEVDAITPSGKPTKKTVKVGTYKTTPNHVKTATGAIMHFATPEETPAKMQGLIDWYQSKAAQSESNPILLATQFHYKYIRIHPFDDGNGRTARILMNFILMKFGYPPVIIKTEDKQNYFAALQQADAGNITPFVKYIAQNLIDSLELIIKGAKGETIEEADDIDKEIALIEQQLKDADKKILKTKNKKTLLDFGTKTLPTITQRFITLNQKLSKFYTKQTYKIIYHKKIDSNDNAFRASLEEMPLELSGLEKQLSIALNAALECLLLKKKNYFIALECKHINFNNKAIKPFDYPHRIEIAFDHSHYIIANDAGNKQTTLYHENIPTEELDTFLKQDIQTHLRYIKKKLL